MVVTRLVVDTGGNNLNVILPDYTPDRSSGVVRAQVIASSLNAYHICSASLGKYAFEAAAIDQIDVERVKLERRIS